MSGHFIAQNARPAHLIDLDLDALTPFQRVLLVIDGTVTQYIEAYMSERIHVECVRQKRVALPESDPWLLSEAGDSVIARDVYLQGERSGRIYAYGTSHIAPGRLGAELLDGVEGKQESLGRLMRQSRAETYRELLWYGLEPADAPPRPGMPSDREPHICRAYRMISEGLPLMVIAERFPLRLNV